MAHIGLDWPDRLASILVIALAATLALQTWHQRRAPERTATAITGGVGVLLAYGTSEALKILSCGRESLS